MLQTWTLENNFLGFQKYWWSFCCQQPIAVTKLSTLKNNAVFGPPSRTGYVCAYHCALCMLSTTQHRALLTISPPINSPDYNHCSIVVYITGVDIIASYLNHPRVLRVLGAPLSMTQLEFYRNLWQQKTGIGSVMTVEHWRCDCDTQTEKRTDTGPEHILR